MSWETVWRGSFGLSEGVPQWIVACLALICVYLLVILPSAVVMAYVDRKLGADFQARVGPNRSGPFGIFQPMADLFKLLQKETRSRWTWQEAFWLMIHTMTLYSTVAVLPLGSLLLLVDTDMSAFVPFWAVLVLALGTMLLGFSQGSVSGWYGGVRVASQTLAGAFPAMIALLCAGLRSGGFRWSQLAGAQSASPLHWTAFSDPFQLVAFAVFMISGMVVLNISPLDSSLSTTDIHGGVSANLSGRRLTLFRMGRFYGFFLWSVIAVVLFMGAWQLPEALITHLSESGSLQLRQALELLLLLLKSFLLMMTIVWVARVSPRTRVDQITDFSWKVLSPFSLFALIGAAFVAGWRVLSG